LKELAPSGYELWNKEPPFDWGHRPAKLIGKTSMKAVWKEYDNCYYYGEVSLDDPRICHGKGICLYKDCK
jgi:hypothetical protein